MIADLANFLDHVSVENDAFQTLPGTTTHATPVAGSPPVATIHSIHSHSPISTIQSRPAITSLRLALRVACYSHTASLCQSLGIYPTC